MIAWTGCGVKFVPEKDTVDPGTRWHSVKEFSHKGHDYLMTTPGHLIHAEHCWNMSHNHYQTNWVYVTNSQAMPSPYRIQ